MSGHRFVKDSYSRCIEVSHDLATLIRMKRNHVVNKIVIFKLIFNNATNFF